MRFRSDMAMYKNLVFVVAMVVAMPAAAAPQALASIIRGYDAWLTEADPIGAAARGNEAASALWPDNSFKSVHARTAELERLKSALGDIPVASLVGEDALNAKLLKWQIDIALQGAAFDETRIPFTSDEGFFVTALYAAQDTVLHTPADAQHWLTRLSKLPVYFAVETQNMRRGQRTGFVQPRVTALAAARTVRQMADTSEAQDPFLAPFATLPADQRAVWRARGLAVIHNVVKSSERDLADYFEKSYVPSSRPSLGASALPNGASYYAYLVKRETTTELTPDQIFAIGQSEIRRIRAAMQVQIAASGFKGDFAAFQAMLRHDPQFYVGTRVALLEKASRLAKLVDDRLPRFFGRLPRLSYGVRPVAAAIEDGYTSARYDPGSPQLGLAGGLLINTSHLDQRPLYELPALVAHEGAPGHHIQIALGQELFDLPEFRQDSEITAFVEGWAVYAEQLVSEMGLYQTPYERFGMLSMEMWRACRLVMDVGLHAKGFTRDQALACLRENTALSEQNMQNEVDRYIAWPGQALGYKIGELKIMELRHRAEAALGSRFDIRAFHDVVLDEGAMPLAILEQRVDDWIAQKKKG
jgi:uncharacterized protein (DUF885 family)